MSNSTASAAEIGPHRQPRLAHRPKRRGLGHWKLRLYRIFGMTVYGQTVYAISNLFVGQAICVDPIDFRHRAILPSRVWADGEPEGVRRRAALEMADTARAAAMLGVDTVVGFIGSKIWKYSDGVARLYFSLADHFEIERLLNAIGELDRGDRWQSLARLSVRDELYASLRLLTMDVLRAAESSDSAAEKIAYWESVNRHRIERSRTVLDEIVTAATCDLAQLSVAAQQVRSMVAGRETEVSPTSTS
ncbi:hypothetical protein [Nocardia sp. NPDC052566]|uniref:hypothetical protein n=1 Tax=Nocardia sp. NPDC052566 TaxID=3364330 RepID=UPI0037C5D6CD